MDLKKLKEVLQIFEKSSLTRLTVREKNGVEITLEKGSETCQSIKSTSVKKTPPVVHYSEPKQIKPQSTHSFEQVEPSKCVKSPMVGTFYRSPSPEDPSYTSEGQEVSSGQILCIIEAMKVMNEIVTEHAGKIKEICVQNGEPVEFGQLLFILE